MLLTKDKNYTLALDIEKGTNHTGIENELVELSFSNKELLHGILTCGMPMQRLTPAYEGKRLNELLYKIFLVEMALEDGGERLLKSKSVLYLDSAEKSVISYYIGMFFTKMISQRIYQVDYLTHLNLIPRGDGSGYFDRLQTTWRPDMIGYQRGEQAWSVWEAKGGSNRRAPALKLGCEQAGEIGVINQVHPKHSAVCMTYYDHGYMQAVVKHAEVSQGEGLEIDKQIFLRTYYEPIKELFQQCRKDLFFTKDHAELVLSIPCFMEDPLGNRNRVIRIGMARDAYEALMEENYDGLLECLEKTKEEESRYQGRDGIYIAF